MNDVLFVQFFNKWISPKGKSYGFLCNGLSHVYNRAKDMGDFVWYEWVADNAEPPITEGTMYLSCFWPRHVYTGIDWAKRYPNLKIIAGGPTLRQLSMRFDPPPNMELRSGLAEFEIFGDPSPSGSFGVDLSGLDGLDYLALTFAVERKCYWSKCIFCGDTWGPDKHFHWRNNFYNLVLPDDDRLWRIWLATPAMSPYIIQNELWKLSPKYTYSTHVRADKAVREAFKEALPKCPASSGFGYNIGVEFPSKRMMDAMNKGIHPDDVLETLDILLGSGCEVNLSFILGWPNLTRDDVDNAKKFCKELKRRDTGGLRMTVWGLHRRSDLSPEARTALNTLVPEWDSIQVYGGNFFREIPRLTKDQRALNVEVMEAYVDTGLYRYLVDSYDRPNRSSLTLRTLLHKDFPIGSDFQHCRG